MKQILIFLASISLCLPSFAQHEKLEREPGIGDLPSVNLGLSDLNLMKLKNFIASLKKHSLTKLDLDTTTQAILDFIYDNRDEPSPHAIPTHLSDKAIKALLKTINGEPKSPNETYHGTLLEGELFDTSQNFFDQRELSPELIITKLELTKTNNEDPLPPYQDLELELADSKNYISYNLNGYRYLLRDTGQIDIYTIRHRGLIDITKLDFKPQIENRMDLFVTFLDDQTLDTTSQEILNFIESHLIID